MSLSFSRFIASVFIITFFSLAASAQENIRSYFGEKYKVALVFVKKNKSFFDKKFSSKEVAIAVSVVFPEILRYNTFSNDAEVHLLRALYIRWGATYANFSVGNFQMKPSFAESIDFQKGKSKPQTEKEREEVLKRLLSMEGQIQYLRDFWDIMFKKYPELSKLKPEAQVVFLASAYNYGFLAPKKDIENWATQKAFPDGKKAKIRFSYAEISKDFFTNEAFKIFP
ncbi:MAG: hypothetical protein SFU27_04205 [Thermonemataceae bacterium]|nr:hypothetical protein [Thermonemataceae bacterium]